MIRACTGLPEEELEEEMTHGRNVQIRHLVPRQSIEARRSRSSAERCGCSPMRLRSLPALLLMIEILRHANVI